MKKKINLIWCEAFSFGVASLFLRFLPCYRCWWCKSTARQAAFLTRFLPVLWWQRLQKICKTVVQQGF